MISRNWQGISLALVAPFATAAMFIARHFDSIKRWARDTVDFILRQFRRLGDLFPSLPNIPGFSWRSLTTPLPFMPFPIPSLAGGGTIMRGGVSLVGERGPELLRLPGGAEVRPLDVDHLQRQAVPSKLVTHVTLLLDGEKVAERSAEIVLDKMARR